MNNDQVQPIEELQEIDENPIEIVDNNEVSENEIKEESEIINELIVENKFEEEEDANKIYEEDDELEINNSNQEFTQQIKNKFCKKKPINK